MERERAKDVRIYRQDVPAAAELKKLLDADKAEGSFNANMAANESVAAFFAALNQAVCYLFVVVKVFYGAFGAGGVIQYAGALGRLGYGLQQLVFGLTDNAVYTTHLKSLFEFLDTPNRKSSGTLPVTQTSGGEDGRADKSADGCADGGAYGRADSCADGTHSIKFSGVSFKYPGSADYAVRGLDLEIGANKKLAVVGVNGSGKTTMIKLLCRLYDPDEGVITLDGVDIKEYLYDGYASLFSVVFQDFKLFALPLGQNVAAAADVDEGRAASNLVDSGFGERLSAMPKGLDTALYKDYEDDGVEISGGEAQKVALARALYKNAPFIILDEPTAALDPIAEFEVYSRFNGIIGDKTAIFISHRLAACRFCDDIAVFHEGALIQRGSHDTLLAEKDGKYYELWNAQARYYNKP